MRADGRRDGPAGRGRARAGPDGRTARAGRAGDAPHPLTARGSGGWGPAPGPPAPPPVHAPRALDQGIGRALWVVGGTDPGVVAGLIERF
ncbi:DUF1702 family protein, partial [Kitasatospora sp. NPDC059408]|uniref:DUF1702 family protein n=1 Tax=Kitasatospora sp. NPDC059408 TaxID=3346823 RepID=UPI00367DDCDD